MRVALITGAGGGIGRATALRLAADGVSVAVNDVRADAAAETVALVEGTGGRAATAAGDVTDAAAVDAMVAGAATTLGPIDILVNNAGGAPPGASWAPVREMKPGDWDGFLALNLTSAFLCSRAVLGGMVERGWGRVVCVNSISSAFGQRAGAGYAAAKAGLTALVASMAKEVAPHGVNVNEVMIGNAPHPSRTPERQAVLDQWSHIPRVGQYEEFAAAIAFLVSDDASYVSGSTLTVDGGTTKFALL